MEVSDSLCLNTFEIHDGLIHAVCMKKEERRVTKGTALRFWSKTHFGEKIEKMSNASL